MPLKVTRERKEDTQEATASLADAKDVSVAAAAEAVSSELGSIFLLIPKKEKKITALEVEKIFSDRFCLFLTHVK